MASTPRAFISWKAMAAALAAAVCMAAPGSSLPEPAWVRNALSLGRAEQLHRLPLVARFNIQEGGAFVLDRSHHPALLKFDDNPEVWALTQSRGPRGDIMFKDDVGDIILRATRLGGVTVFTSRDPEGSAAALVGTGRAPQLTPIGPQGLYQRLVVGSARCSHATRRLVGFEAPDVDAKSAAVIADAAEVTVVAVIAVQEQAVRRVAMRRLSRVVFTKGATPDVVFRGGVLNIIVAPPEGLAGYPSSQRIARAIEGY